MANIRLVASAVCLVTGALALMPAWAQSETAADSSKEQTALPALRGEMNVPVQTEPTVDKLDRTHGEDWHRVSLRLEGSMCPACLLELEGKLRAFPGVIFAKINRDPHAGDQTASIAQRASAGDTSVVAAATTEHKPKHASSVLIFDNHTITFDKLNQCIKRELYKSLDVKDVAIPAPNTP